jgi:HSP20 family protein
MWAPSPLRTLERFADEVESIFDDFGLGRSWLGPNFGRRWVRTPWRPRTKMWAPEIEIAQKENELVIRADLPGLKKDDVCVDVTDNSVTISGERRLEEETERGGIYRSDRSYGSFCRTIPLPEGAMADQANARFKDGVLEIRMPALESTRGRRLEIKESTESKK